MKPYPKREHFTADMLGGWTYSDARADWLMSEVVPLLKRARVCVDGIAYESRSVAKETAVALRDAIDAVLAELESKT